MKTAWLNEKLNGLNEKLHALKDKLKVWLKTCMV